MRIYLDNCSFNRPFDDQNQVRIRLEAEAKLFIQTKIFEKELEDDLILAKKSRIAQINIVNPLDFIQLINKT